MAPARWPGICGASGYVVGRKRIRRLMQRMGLCAVYQKPRTTVPAEDHEAHP